MLLVLGGCIPVATLQGATTEVPTKPAALTDAELVTRTISQFFAAEIDAHRTAELAKMHHTLADLQRHLRLDTVRHQHLEIAAAGAVERAMRSWKIAFDKQLRERTKEATASTITGELANLRGESIRDRSATENKVWTTALDDTLTAAEKVTWVAACSERRRWRERAITELMLSELQLSIHLSPQQSERLCPLAARAVHDYLDDFNRSSDRGSELSPAINGLSLFIKAMPEAEAKAIITLPQWQSWTTQWPVI